MLAQRSPTTSSIHNEKDAWQLRPAQEQQLTAPLHSALALADVHKEVVWPSAPERNWAKTANLQRFP
jgi:hypothetical protein